jgi:hypothetical protein
MDRSDPSEVQPPLGLLAQSRHSENGRNRRPPLGFIMGAACGALNAMASVIALTISATLLGITEARSPSYGCSVAGNWECYPTPQICYNFGGTAVQTYRSSTACQRKASGPKPSRNRTKIGRRRSFYPALHERSSREKAGTVEFELQRAAGSGCRMGSRWLS